MLNLFRKTRKKLADDNKPAKYFRYAIGEILLVVIGILIALSINNWNIQQIEQKEERDYLERFIKDLNYDLSEITAVVKTNQRRLYQISVTLDSLGVFAKRYDRSNIWKGDIDSTAAITQIINRSFGFGLTAIRYYDEYNYSDATYREILANGKIDLIRDEQLKVAILDYYIDLEDKLQLVNMVGMMRNDYVQTLAKQGISMYNRISSKEFDSLVSNKGSIIAEIENIFYITVASQNALKFTDNSIEQNTKALIFKIEEYLD